MRFRVPQACLQLHRFGLFSTNGVNFWMLESEQKKDDHYYYISCLKAVDELYAKQVEVGDHVLYFSGMVFEMFEEYPTVRLKKNLTKVGECISLGYLACVYDMVKLEIQTYTTQYSTILWAAENLLIPELVYIIADYTCTMDILRLQCCMEETLD